MGIKFHCPNGHRMHVKAFLAGRRGLCPTCGAKVEIPFQSEPETAAGNSIEQSGEAQAAAASDAALDESTDTIVFDLPYVAAPPISPAEPWSSPQEAAVAEHPAVVGFAPPAAMSDGSAASSEAHSTSQDRAPKPSSTRWYVRIGSGEQFGPVRDEMMRQWFAKGRIVAKTPVWREGWADWRPASTVFSQAGALVPTPPEITAKPMSSADLSEALAFARPVAVDRVQKREPWTNRQWTTAISLMLLLLVVILGTIMLFMLLGQVQQPVPEPASQSTTTSSPFNG